MDYIPDKNAGFRAKENLYPLRALLSESITKYLTQTSNYSTCFKSVRSHGTKKNIYFLSRNSIQSDFFYFLPRKILDYFLVSWKRGICQGKFRRYR